MSKPVSKTAWIYVIIKNPGKSELMLGFEGENGIKYIPAIHSKEDAEMFISYIQREPGTRYEVQAIIHEDLLDYAKDNQSLVFIVDKEGKILEKIDPND